jgi:aminoglycoside phosphotransferase (APT) family kinase protein
MPGSSILEETTEVREAHRFAVEPLRAYLSTRVDGIGTDFEVRQFRGGQSNPTFALVSDGRAWVLRKKPPGVLLPSAHMVEREYRIMKALGDTDVPVARVHLLCEDPDVIGTPFFVMDLVEGRVFRSELLPDIEPSERRAVYVAMVDALAKLHKVDVRAVGLEDFGKTGNYMGRQLSRWQKQYEASKTEDIPAMSGLSEWLAAHMPEDDSTTIAHGDYRLENLIYHPTEPRVLAVLDWELSTLGHPLADLGYNCMAYHLESTGTGGSGIHQHGRGIHGPDLVALGIPSEAEYVAEYSKRAGRAVPDLDYYVAFAMFRRAAICQGVYKRGLDGNASSENALNVKPLVRFYSEGGWELVRTQG